MALSADAQAKAPFSEIVAGSDSSMSGPRITMSSEGTEPVGAGAVKMGSGSGPGVSVGTPAKGAAVASGAVVAIVVGSGSSTGPGVTAGSEVSGSEVSAGSSWAADSEPTLRLPRSLVDVELTPALEPTVGS